MRPSPDPSAIYALINTRNISWCTTALDTTASSLRHNYVTRVHGRCICSVIDTELAAQPSTSSISQPSLWHARRDVRRIIFGTWALVAGYVVWGAVIFHSTGPGLGGGAQADGSVRVVLAWWVWYPVIATTQGSLTLVLHFAEVVVSSLRDEATWREAAGARGPWLSSNPVRNVFSSWTSVFLLAAKPFLHWMFSLCCDMALIQGDYTQSESEAVTNMHWYLSMGATQIWNLSIALDLFAALLTLLARQRPQGPQPATYGHIQTLANLVDEWPADGAERLWWGHKGSYTVVGSGFESGGESAKWYHAGTSGRPLPPVRIEGLYA
ncbi:hypothetical protein CONPUDRAFT_166029 [Coniophora puteana RWD-64-598 SS2]|uniref:Uncharacterized protein n=1 Tax=Coniophora puteana (strain RWD-64-598) TaxID=741705 RepID=A0A5M3MP64_CONPW|nr:uncharacterized protein CONPUDRAFT_166029 [Coniophora puteana RWD-64-598 SS2]EIW80524.1 hypothetical protein CONPUDRAFT_166029 [Coniophora puteana RWD-64-598 SS2]